AEWAEWISGVQIVFLGGGVNPDKAQVQFMAILHFRMKERVIAAANPRDAGIKTGGLRQGDEELIDVQAGGRAALQYIVDAGILLGSFAFRFLRGVFGIVFKIMDSLSASVQLAKFGFGRIGRGGQLLRQVANGTALAD